MTTTTSVSISSSAYTQVSTGSANVTIQGTGGQVFEIYVGTTAPSPNSPATPGQVVGERDGYAISLAGLTGTDNVYVRACNPAGGTVRVVAS